MPACEFGAEPIPIARDIQRWADQLAIPIEILGLVQRIWPAGYLGLVAELIDYNELCAANPDPPEAITLQDVLEASQALATPMRQPSPALLDKIWRWIRYGQFLSNCQCLEYVAPDPTHNCMRVGNLSIGGLGSVLPLPDTIVDQAIFDAWNWPATGQWTWWRSGSGQVDGGAFDGNALDIQIQLTTGAWTTVDDIQTLNLQGFICNTRNMASVTPKFTTPVHMRLVNNAGGTHLINNLNYCFCGPAGAPQPFPVQDPLTTIPNYPVITCDGEDICGRLMEIGRRLDRVAIQISDLQARMTAGDVLVELSRTTIQGEGELELALGTRAVSVELTAIGSGAYTSALGRPRGLMRVGNYRWGTPVGYTARVFIDGDRFDVPRPPNVTSLSYQLLAGTQGILKFLG